MSIKRNLGGDRLGSGNKMQMEMHSYFRSTHNLTETFRSSMAPGVLYPFTVKPALIGDTFDFDLEAMVKTLPTNGPLMGTFKLQLDLFFCPLRLYQGILHNNALELGLNMKDVKLPSLHLYTHYDRHSKNFKTSQINPRCLLKYLGLSGLGTGVTNVAVESVGRYVGAVPVLAYYDIFKNYYANKQEENAYVISGNTYQSLLDRFYYFPMSFHYTNEEGFISVTRLNKDNIFTEKRANGNPTEIGYDLNSLNKSTDTPIRLDEILDLYLNISTFYSGDSEDTDYSGTIKNLRDDNYITLEVDQFSWKIKFNLQKIEIPEDGYVKITLNDSQLIKKADNIILKAFPLENIDKMRREILSRNNISDHLVIGDDDEAGEVTFMPYQTLTDHHAYGDGLHEETDNTYNLNGLVVKTYQSDIFNNWINRDYITGTNGINEITRVDTSDGSFTMDALNLAQKVYNMLNRIVTCGGTYQDWQEAISGQQVAGHMETPIYCGGMSSEVVFEELPSMVGTENAPLGTLGGKGKLAGKKGGHVVIKVGELGFIIGLASLTPRVDYSTGNEFYMTDLQTADDFHKPALDGIGFQDLIGEQMAWWDTKVDGNGNIIGRSTVGKIPAWLNYMTSVNKVYGDFAETVEGANFMVLSRNYSVGYSTNDMPIVTDFTTYIDPAKFNYAFAVAKLDAQNFWVQIESQITARRLMSAKVIPNL